MPALAPYIPSKDSQLDLWLANFSTLITAAPATYGLLVGDATAIAAAVLAWHNAYLLVTSPTTKTASTVSDKNTQKVTVLAIVRPYAQQISNNACVTSANKIALGLNPKTSTPVPITAPTTNPVLTVQSAPNLAVIIRYRDSVASPSVKSKPYGVVGVQIYCSQSATPITDPTLLAYNQTATKSPLQITYLSGDVGKQSYIAARYITKKGLFGPWSPIINFTVAASH
jgi:hypothetical protein